MTLEPTDFTAALSHNKEKLLNIGPKDWDLVLKHYDITNEIVNDMVRNIREWLKKQPHLPEDKIQDQKIAGFLMFRGFSVEKVKEALDSVCYAPHRMPDLVCNRDPLSPEIDEYTKRGYYCVMPKKTPENYRVMFFRILPENSPASVPMLIKIPFLAFEYRIWNEMSLGDCWVFDLENVGMHETLQMTPVVISNLVYYVMACFGARLKSVYVFNLPSYGLTVLNIIKKIVKKKLGDRIHVKTKEEILQSFPKECVPTDYGGEGGNFQQIADEWRKTLQSDAWRQYFLEQEGFSSDESKRLAPSPDDELFGTNGYFRQLNID